MEEKGNLDRLASGLSLEERRELLEKLTAGSELTRGPLYEYALEGPAQKTAEQYNALPWFSRLWLFILSIFSGKPPRKLFEDRQAAAQGREIALRWPGLYDYQQGMLLPAFYNAISALKNGARFFYTALDAGVNQDKGAFYGFLGSLELPEIHRRLQTGTDPEAIIQKTPGLSDTELRQEALRAVDEILPDITTADREAMYANVRSLHYLKELSSFLFDRVLTAFSVDKALAGLSCPARLVKDMLNSLNNILYSLRLPPAMPLLESLFIFILQERENAPDFDLQKEIEALLAQSEASLRCIKEFNKKVPLTRILRSANRNMSLLPRTISGGEDWFALYGDYWKRYAEDRLSRFFGSRREKALLGIVGDFFGYAPLEPPVAPKGFPLKGAYSLSFLLTFHKLIVPALIPPAPAGIAADECYDFLRGLGDKILQLDNDISPAGDFGRRYNQIRGDMSSLQAKRRKLQLVEDEAAEAADRIITAARAVFLTLSASETPVPEPPAEPPVAEPPGRFQRALKILDDIGVMESAMEGTNGRH